MNIAASLALVEHVIGHVFEDKLLGVEALNSDCQLVYCNQNHHDLRRNDDLGVLGDKAIDLVLISKWYQKRDSQAGRPLSKGQLSDLQRDLVSEKSLADRGFDHGLDKHVIKNPGHYGRISNRMMANTVEAIIGAVYEDTNHDYERAHTVMGNLGFFEHPLLLVTDDESPYGFGNREARAT
ncbi:ribonuclease III [Lizonia empirigonia]|nr:ribonuclease III [Lizonia empirigonia]